MSKENTYFLLLNLLPFAFTLFLYKLNGKCVIAQKKSILKSSLLVLVVWSIVDILFVQNELWFYNSKYHLGITILGLPLEKLLQTFLITYSTLLAYNWIKEKLNFKNKKWFFRMFAFLTLIISLPMGYFHWYDWHTFFASSLFNLSLLYLLLFVPTWTSNFIITFWVISIPYIYLQLALSGYFYKVEMFTYNTLETQGFFVVSFPLEELMYFFGLSLFSVLVLEKDYAKRKL